MFWQTAPDRDSGSNRQRIHRGESVNRFLWSFARAGDPWSQSARCMRGLFFSRAFFALQSWLSRYEGKSISGFVGLSECRSGFADGSGSRFWFRPSKNPPRGVSKQVSLEFRLSRPRPQFVKVAHVHPAAVRRLPSVRILKCFCRRLRIAILVPTVKESTAGSQTIGFPGAREFLSSKIILPAKSSFHGNFLPFCRSGQKSSGK